MLSFSFSKLKQAYRQSQFDKKLDFLVSDFNDDIDRDIFLFCSDKMIKENVARLLKNVDALITKFKMDEKRTEIVNCVDKYAKNHVNRYIQQNIKHLPNRVQTPLPF